MFEPDRGGSNTKEADTIIAMAPLAVTFTEDELDDIDGDPRRLLQPQRRNSPGSSRPRVTTTPQRNRPGTAQRPENIPLVDNRNGGSSRDGQLASKCFVLISV